MALQQTLTVTTNGTYDLGSNPTTAYSYKVDGNFGAGSIEIGYVSNSVFVRYADIPASAVAAQGVITCGNGSSVAFKLSGATSPQIFINVSPV